jgi:hypothetical protein
MSKIVQAVNAMVANPQKITNVLGRPEGEIFFLYKEKYKWSMDKRDADYWLWFYPGKQALQALARYENEEWEDVPMVTYKASEIGTREAKASFADLYTLLTEKLHGIHEVLDDIIKDENVPF